MNKMRKIEEIVENYKRTILYDPQVLKKYLEEHIYNVTELKEVTNDYLKCMICDFGEWCNVSVAVFDKNGNNIFQKVKRKIDMLIVNHYLNKISKDISKLNLMIINIGEIETRLMQFKYIA